MQHTYHDAQGDVTYRCHTVIRTLAIALALGIVAAACGSEQQTAPPREAEPNHEGSHTAECGTPGSETDLTAEPRYGANYLHRWTNADGCPVRLDIVMTRRGTDACGGPNVADILMGWPLGSSHSHRPYRIFLRDPHEVFGNPHVSGAFDDDAERPADAVDTGYRQNGAELWMRPNDDGFVYLVFADRVEQWPRATPPGCA
jgi:hypothetical protein